METLSNVYQMILAEALAATWTIVWHALLFLVVGLVAGIASILAARRRGLLRRDFRVWTWIVGLNYVYVPLLLMIMGFVIGGLFGAQRVTWNFIESSTDPIVAYARVYLPEMQAFVNEGLDLERGQNITVEELIAQRVAAHIGDESGFLARRAIFLVESAALTLLVEQVVVGDQGSPNVEPTAMGSETYLDNNILQTIDKLRNLDASNVDPEVFELLPDTLYQTVNSHFMVWYGTLLAMFAPFLLITLGEMCLFGLYRMVRRKSGI